MADHSNGSTTELANERTDMAEDRTILANERTFAGWMRTGLACVGIGVGFNVLFDQLDPAWLPRAVATVFLLIGVFVFWAAERSSCAVMARLSTHQVKSLGTINMRLVAGILSAGAATIAVGIWVLR